MKLKWLAKSQIINCLKIETSEVEYTSNAIVLANKLTWKRMFKNGSKNYIWYVVLQEKFEGLKNLQVIISK